MTSEELGTATRAELQEYLEGRGFAVYESEPVEVLREAALLDLALVERGDCGGKYRNGPEKRYVRCDRCHRIDWESNEGDRCRR